jgi:hypothetical protein
VVGRGSLIHDADSLLMGLQCARLMLLRYSHRESYHSHAHGMMRRWVTLASFAHGRDSLTLSLSVPLLHLDLPSEPCLALPCLALTSRTVHIFNLTTPPLTPDPYLLLLLPSTTSLH